MNNELQPKEYVVAENFYKYIATNKQTGQKVHEILDEIDKLSKDEIRTMLAYFVGYVGNAIRCYEAIMA